MTRSVEIIVAGFEAAALVLFIVDNGYCRPTASVAGVYHDAAASVG